jgi:hypothetical protein
MCNWLVSLLFVHLKYLLFTTLVPPFVTTKFNHVTANALAVRAGLPLSLALYDDGKEPDLDNNYPIYRPAPTWGDAAAPLVVVSDIGSGNTARLALHPVAVPVVDEGRRGCPAHPGQAVFDFLPLGSGQATVRLEVLTTIAHWVMLPALPAVSRRSIRKCSMMGSTA